MDCYRVNRLVGIVVDRYILRISKFRQRYREIKDFCTSMYIYMGREMEIDKWI